MLEEFEGEEEEDELELEEELASEPDEFCDSDAATLQMGYCSYFASADPSAAPEFTRTSAFYTPTP